MLFSNISPQIFACRIIRPVANDLSKNLSMITCVRIFVQLFRKGLESLSTENC